MKRIYLILSILGIILAAIFVVVVSMDLSYVLSNKETFSHIYHVSPDSSLWVFRSIINYVSWNIVLLFICLIYIILSITSLRKRLIKLRIALLFFEFLVLLLMIRYLLLWVNSGYDHFPGFNPFMF